MSASSRAQSQSSRYSRKRSDTAQSAYKPTSSAAPLLLTAAPPIKVGESKTLAAWVHEPERSAAVIFNHNWWPGIDEGDLLRVTLGNSESGFLFCVPGEDQNLVKPQLQVRFVLSTLLGHVQAYTFFVTPFLFFKKDIHPWKYCRGIWHQEQWRDHGHEGEQRGWLPIHLHTNSAPKHQIQGG